MRPKGLKTKIFLDSGDPQETREALSILGFLDGQTTNPSLVAKNPQVMGKKFPAAQVFNFYEGVVREISELLPSSASVSIEVYADKNTKAEEMLAQAREFFLWIPNSHIKFPITAEGLKAADEAVGEGMRVNMTLCFSQAQAAAVYVATKDASRGDVFISPFVGRLDDRGENGMDLIANILKMYGSGDKHVEVLTASVRSLEHFTRAIELGSDIITAPLSVLKQWKDAGMPVVSSQPASSSQGGQTTDSGQLKPIPYQEIGLDKPWPDYNIQHELTDKGIEKFSQDWNNLIQQN